MHQPAALPYLVFTLPEHLLFADVVDAEKPSDADEHPALVGTDGRREVLHLRPVHQLQGGALVHQSVWGGGVRGRQGSQSSPVLQHQLQSGALVHQSVGGEGETGITVQPGITAPAAG